MRIFITTLAVCLMALSHSSTLKAQDAQLSIANHTFEIELAITEEERIRGLQHRQSLAPNTGMLFIYDKPLELIFWMKNTLIPLDILYFDSDATLVHYHDSAPPCTSLPCPHYPSLRPVIYVLELNAGTRQRLGISLGQRFEIIKQN